MRKTTFSKAAAAIAVVFAAAATQVAAAGTATAADGEHFVLFSNKSALVYRWCVRALDTDSNVIKGDCDRVGLRGKSTFWVPTNATKIMYEWGETAAGGGKGGPITVDNDKNWCFRMSSGSSFHEATEQPCTPK